ncbi:Flp pilus assembly protein TadB [Carboxydocella sporoproducens DSM 16521]|uniref:Flp pilus assembly protein TadB n=2 Tax=Carboxydocella TaxID=178898 RepID=A0A1T4M286_9FIRM|nr:MULTISPECIES: type II secretion system F family protein [Carboxydocella]AVX21077.1 Flp pilus assembly protein TadB [Carboxydocella thermautotrophica]AVX31497.1 Flp pilus assembly protein TadB [Carboxydocella thermautotrophica]SJZ61073.1 Flp pilus assembly protein TadB [Carboxydocella sporoproducens DSM 16521]
MLLAAELFLAVSACLLVWWAFRENELELIATLYRKLPKQVVLVLGGVLLGAGVGFLSGSNFIVILLIFCGGALPYFFYRKQLIRQQQRLVEQMVACLYQLASLYGVCNNVYHAFVQTAQTAPEPLKSVLQELLADWELAGLSTNEAMARLEERIPHDDVRFFCRIISLAEQTGGNIKDIMLQVPESLQERQLLREEGMAELKGYIAQAWLLILLVPGFLLTFYLLQPEFIYLLMDTALGKGALSLVLFITALAAYLVDRVVSPQEWEDMAR